MLFNEEMETKALEQILFPFFITRVQGSLCMSESPHVCKASIVLT